MSTPPRFLETAAPKKYEGVEGWLVVFCLILIFFVPVSTLYQVFGNVLPLISRTHDSRREILWTVYVIFFLGIAGFGLVTGIRLWMVRPGVVRLAKAGPVVRQNLQELRGMARANSRSDIDRIAKSFRNPFSAVRRAL